jgi:hypothetical protein
MKVKYVVALIFSFGLVGCGGQGLVTRVGGDIEVVSASYGPNCGAPQGNVTGHLASSCNDTNRCSYTIDYKVIGDPARACQKSYEAQYRCRSSGQTKSVSAPPEAGLGSVVVLDCTRSLWGVIFPN